MDSSTTGTLSVAGVAGIYVVAAWLWLRPKRSSSREVASLDQDRSVSIFGRRRLPRGDPHQWADRLEDWFARLTWHVRFLYFLVISMILALVIHIAYAH